ncbi:MAG: ABC transporter substrate-binding protein [Acidobacteriota bacterium]
MLRSVLLIAALLMATPMLSGCVRGHGRPKEQVRVGFFPNLTHAQALVGMARGDFERAMEPLRLVPRPLNAGPQAMEALLAGELDFAYVGSGPAINAYVRSRGALRVVAGVASGGVSFVVRADSRIQTAEDLRHRTLATPAIGNTQDIALRTFLKDHALAPREKGGSVRLVPMANPDILHLMRRGDIHGAWVPEPWVTRLLREAQGRLFLDERDLWPQGRFASAVLVASRGFIGERPDLVLRFVRAHVEVTRWIERNPAEARALINSELARLLGQPLPVEVLSEAFSRLEVTYDPIEESLLRSAERARGLGFLGHQRLNLRGLLELDFLRDVLAEEPPEPPVARRARRYRYERSGI